MNKKHIDEDLIYPSVELQVLEPNETDCTVESQPNLDSLDAKEVTCPKCGSKDCWKRGNTSKGSKEYSCKDCKRFFTVYPLIDEQGREIKCCKCQSRNYIFGGKTKDGIQVYKCRDCGSKYILDLLRGGKAFKCTCCGGNNCYRTGTAKTGKPVAKCLDCAKRFTVGGDYIASLIAPVKFDFNHDVWKTEHLGYEKGVHNHNKLNFGYIEQPWLKYYFKKFILYLSSTRLAFGTLIGKIGYIQTFSRFLTSIGYSQEFEGINRDLILQYFAYLKTNKYSYSQHTHCISTLKTFFETGILNHWFQVDPALIRPEDWLKQPKRLPRFIPEEVMKQLNQHLDGLPEPVMRMVLVDIECGFRVGELLRLKFDCLKSNGKGEWYIQYQMYKMNKEHTKPVSNELAQVIQEQQAYIRQVFDNKFDYLFCGRARSTKSGEFLPEPKLMTSTSFIGYLKRLAQQFDIQDNLGKPWNFQSHQFRHTVGTRMINAGVPQHIIQRYLGHETPTMTMVYAHIFDETLRQEIEKYHESRVVNFQGATVELEETILSSNNDLEWFKKNLQARALEHGYCARPKVLGDCDIPGFDGCYNCSHWRTNQNFLPILKDTLERTEKVIEKARNYGWELQVSKNEPIKHNLEKVIKSLEEQGNEQKD
jgi:integrase/transposase-like protein